MSNIPQHTGSRMSNIPQHSSGSNEFYTPARWVDPARELMGSIELDPASSWLANEVVKAERFFGHMLAPLAGKGEPSSWLVDGSFAEWRARTAFLNPPGGRSSPEMRQRWGSSSSAVCWWSKLANHWQRDEVGEAIFVGFTLEILSTTQALDEARPMMAFPICVPGRRINFDLPDAVDSTTGGPWSGLTPAVGTHRVEARATRVASKSATHANVIAYLPPRGDKGKVQVDRFLDIFGKLGAVKL